MNEIWRIDKKKIGDGKSIKPLLWWADGWRAVKDIKQQFPRLSVLC